MGAPVEEAAERWAADLAAWAIPPEILAAAAESPWSCVPADFRVADEGAIETPSAPFEREVLPVGGTVLDVGCGGGRASLALAPPAWQVIGVDESRDMLTSFEAAATARAVRATTHLGRWPDIASAVPAADLVVCHHVAYNVPDIVAFLEALTAHARLAVVLELTSHHPQSAWSPAWRHFWGLERPDGPTAADLQAIVGSVGWEPEVRRQRRPAEDDPFTDRARAIRSTTRRLCLPRDRADDVAAYLAAHPLAWPAEVVTLRWPGKSPEEPAPEEPGE